MNFIKYIHDHIRWSKKTFGEGAFSTRLVNHIRKELDEITAKPTDLEEWIDVIILALDGAWRAGYTAADIAKMLRAKQKKNYTRQFIVSDNPDQPAEHDRSQEKGSAVKSSRVTMKDLEREIEDLRVGLGRQTLAMHSLQQENAHLTRALSEARQEILLTEREFVNQQVFNGQIHESLALLIRKMPYANQPLEPSFEIAQDKA